MTTLASVTRGVRNVVKTFANPRHHVECRHCGTNLSHDATECPACGHGEPTTFVLE